MVLVDTALEIESLAKVVFPDSVDLPFLRLPFVESWAWPITFILVLLLLITSITSISYAETDRNGTVSIYLDKNKIIDICIMISTPGGVNMGGQLINMSI